MESTIDGRGRRDVEGAICGRVMLGVELLRRELVVRQEEQLIHTARASTTTLRKKLPNTGPNLSHDRHVYLGTNTGE